MARTPYHLTHKLARLFPEKTVKIIVLNIRLVCFSGDPVMKAQEDEWDS